MADLGKVVVTDGGNYSANVTYEKLTFVHYQGDAYMTLKTVKGVTPTDDGVNYRLFCKSAELATATKAGIVLPDGNTTTVDSSGKISVKKATTSAAGIVKPAATDFTVEEDGTQKINTQFTQATELANIIAGEAIAQVLGKVSKAIATTMNLDQNALLKNMLTGIDVNDANKVPNMALIHTLIERIGMGTSLGNGFANLTAGLNSVKKGLDDTNSNFAGIIPSSKLLYCFKDIPQLAKKTNKEDERAEILRWYKTIPINSVGIAFHSTDVAGFFQGGGRRLLLAFSKGEYGGILIMSYWKNQAISYATVENNVLSDRIDFVIK